MFKKVTAAAMDQRDNLLLLLLENLPITFEDEVRKISAKMVHGS